MEILFYHPTFDTARWLKALAKAIPCANVREWKRGDNAHADYALVWHPPVDMLAGRKLKAVFALGAGVDSILSKLKPTLKCWMRQSRFSVWKIPVWVCKCRNMR